MIVFRVDASFLIGTGHLMRCITLALELRNAGETCIFISKRHDATCKVILEKYEFPIFYLEIDNAWSPTNIYSSWLGSSLEVDALETLHLIEKNHWEVTWIIIDHYGINSTWESFMRQAGYNVAVIDDLTNRTHNCHLLINQNYLPNLDKEYSLLINHDCQKLLGPSYAILRDEFLELRATKLTSDFKTKKRCLLFFGGSDPTRETFRILSLLEQFPKTIHYEIVVGLLNSDYDKIRAYCAHRSNFSVHYNINYMARLMSEVDFAICAGGSTTWERYALGVPAFLISVADNQIHISQALHQLGIDMYIGNSPQLTSEAITSYISQLYSPSFYDSFIKRGKTAIQLVNGEGKKRIVDLIKKR